MTCYIYGDPSKLVDGIRARERREAKLLAGTGCDTCQHAITAWDITVCDIGERHPRCVRRGLYVERSE